MKKQCMAVISIITFMFVAVLAVASESAHWDYAEDGMSGPKHWGEIDPHFVMCSLGKNQSPVDLTDMVESDLAAISFAYQDGGNVVVNNGHTVQVNYAPGSMISVGGHQFELKQFHFHTPSENTIRGEFMPMEAHLVHADQEGNLAVIALMFKTGENNAELEKAWAVMPKEPGVSAPLAEVINADRLLPADRGYYRFNGSLTTPPCSEGVVWLVMKREVMASPEQIQQFADIMKHPNNRPVQPKNARLILQ